jgi:hypothetical protein
MNAQHSRRSCSSMQTRQCLRLHALPANDVLMQILCRILFQDRHTNSTNFSCQAPCKCIHNSSQFQQHTEPAAVLAAAQSMVCFA